jgi:predicted amidohydrolase
MSTLRISIIQTPLQWEEKKSNLDMLEQKIAAIPEKTELIVLPEMFSTGFSMNKEVLAENMEGPTVQWMKETAAKKTAIITGSFICKDMQNGVTSYYNRMVWMLPNGEFGYYDKRHLFAYGKENLHYSAGQKRFIASVNGWKLNLQICYDLRFPVWIRQSKGFESPDRPEYDLLVIVANWPLSRAHAWRTLLAARAIENQCYVIGVNRTGTDGYGLQYGGESMILGPLGEPIKKLTDEAEVYSHTLHREYLEETRSKYPFWRDADRFHIQP